jgi:hypothetical protein
VTKIGQFYDLGCWSKIEMSWRAWKAVSAGWQHLNFSVVNISLFETIAVIKASAKNSG